MPKKTGQPIQCHARTWREDRRIKVEAYMEYDEVVMHLSGHAETVVFDRSDALRLSKALADAAMEIDNQEQG